MVVPIPFTRAIFLYGEPICVARGANVDEERVRVERVMHELADRVERDFDELWRKG